MKLAVWTRRMPWSIVVVAAMLVLFGCLGIARYEELVDGSGRYLRQQVVWAGLAMIAMLLTIVPNYRVLCRWSYTIFAIALVLLVVVFFFPPVNHARRWIRIGAIGFQPSEFVKIAFVLALGRYLMYRENHRRLSGLFLPLGLALLPVVLILREPDLGTALVFFPVLFLMLFVAGVRKTDLLKLAVAGLICMPLLWTQMSREQRSRVTALFEQAGPRDVPSDDAYHLYRAKQVLALGGVWGSFLAGQPTNDMAAYRLPEGRSDFIFCIIGERFGIPGIVFVLGLFAILVWRGGVIAAATREPFGRLVATGLVGLIGVQVLVNTGMSVGLLPITGLSLPMVSYGGSGLLTQGILLGVLSNIAIRPGYEMANEPFRYTE